MNVRSAIVDYLSTHYVGNEETKEEMFLCLDSLTQPEYVSQNNTNWKNDDHLWKAFVLSIHSIEQMKKCMADRFLTLYQPNANSIMKFSTLLDRGFLPYAYTDIGIGGFLAKDLLISLLFNIPQGVELVLNSKYIIRPNTIKRYNAVIILNGDHKSNNDDYGYDLNNDSIKFSKRILDYNPHLRRLLSESFFFITFVVGPEDILDKIYSMVSLSTDDVSSSADDETELCTYDEMCSMLLDNTYSDYEKLYEHVSGNYVSNEFAELVSLNNANMAELNDILTNSDISIENLEPTT